MLVQSYYIVYDSLLYVNAYFFNLGVVTIRFNLASTCQCFSHEATLCELNHGLVKLYLQTIVSCYS